MLTAITGWRAQIQRLRFAGTAAREAHVTRAGVLLTAVLAAASVGVFAQDSPKSASAPPQDGSQTTQVQNSTPQSSNNTVANGTQTASEDGMPAQQLPQTSTILPLLGLIGLGSLVAGLFARR